MLGIIKKMFIVAIFGIVNASNHAKYVLLGNQKCKIQSYYYPFAVKLDRFVGSCNTLNDLSNKLCIPNNSEDLNRSGFNMITGINESKTLTKHILSECKCEFGKKNIIQINGGITMNVNVSVQSIVYVKKYV